MKQPPPFVVMSTWCIPRRVGWPMSDSIFTCSACGRFAPHHAEGCENRSPPPLAGRGNQPGGSTLLPPVVRMRRCPRMRLGAPELGPLINGAYVAAGEESRLLLASWLK